MMTCVRLGASWCALAALALAPSLVLPVAQAIAATPAPVWVVDQRASRLGFRSSTGGEAFDGQFTRWQSAIRFDPKNLAGSSVQVQVDLTSARTGSADRDEALPGDDWFNAAKFGRATFTARTFRDLGGGRYQAVGTLSLRGVTRPLALAFQLRIQGNQARMVGSATVDRHVFGVGQGQFAGADSIPFAVRVNVSLSARRT